MKDAGIAGLMPKRWRQTTDSDHQPTVAPNLLERDFTADTPNRAWVADIAYLRMCEAWLYLAAIVDLDSRRVAGWAAADPMRTELVAEALQKATQRRQPEPALIHHSYRGSQLVRQR